MAAFGQELIGAVMAALGGIAENRFVGEFLLHDPGPRVLALIPNRITRDLPAALRRVGDGLLAV